MREFVSKKKTVRITVDGQAFEMKCPSIQDSESLTDELSKCDSSLVFEVYQNNFEKWGLPKSVCKQMDREDFVDLIKFIFNPKESGPQATP